MEVLGCIVAHPSLAMCRFALAGLRLKTQGEPSHTATPQPDHNSPTHTEAQRTRGTHRKQATRQQHQTPQPHDADLRQDAHGARPTHETRIPSSHRGKGRLRACTPKRLLTPRRAARRARRSPWNKAIHITKARLHTCPSAQASQLRPPPRDPLRLPPPQHGRPLVHPRWELSVQRGLGALELLGGEHAVRARRLEHVHLQLAALLEVPGAHPGLADGAARRAHACPGRNLRSEQARQLRTLRLSHHGCA